MVAWVARKPRSRSAAASSCWVRIGRCSTRSRMARWRSCFMTSMDSAIPEAEPRDDDERREADPVQDEDTDPVRAEVAEDDSDREQAREERGDHAGHQRDEGHVDARLAGDDLAKLPDSRAGGDRGGHQEREPR